MIENLRKTIIAQFEAGLCMFNDCVQKCPDSHWDGKVAKYPFWQVAYHTVCFVDLYLTIRKDDFVFQDLHPNGWAEFDDEHPSRRFTREEILRYIDICRKKAAEIISTETIGSLQGESGFEWLRFSRLEAHLYNIRHIQHHTGQLSSFVRRCDPAIDPRWVGSGWK